MSTAARAEDGSRLTRRAGATVRSVASAVLPLLALAGCTATSTGPSVSSTSPTGAAAVFAEYLAQAEKGGADELQLQALRDAVASGELGFETVDELLQRSFACLDAAGIGHEEWAPREVVPGYFLHSGSFSGQAPGMTEDETLATADACFDKHSQFASLARADTRAYQDLWDAHVAERLPLMIECLEENGVHVDPDATVDEVVQAVGQLASDTSTIDDGNGAVDCYLLD